MKWFLIALFGGIGLFFYFHFHQSPAFLAYLQFDRARCAGDCGVLQKMCDGPAKAWADQFCAAGSVGDALAGLAGLAQGADGAYALANTAGGLSGLQDAAGISIVRRVVSEDEADDGTITLVAEWFPIDRNNDPGSAKFMPSAHRHALKLKPVGEGFVVLKFDDAIEKK